MKSDSIKTRQIGVCIAYHIWVGGLQDDKIVSILEGFLNTLGDNATWLPGEFKQSSKQNSHLGFRDSINDQLELFRTTYEGVRTRHIGTILITNPLQLSRDAQSKQIFIGIRKYQDAYTFSVTAIGKSGLRGHKGTANLVNVLKIEAKRIFEEYFVRYEHSFNSNLMGPTTEFQFILKWGNQGIINSEQPTLNTDVHEFISRSFLASESTIHTMPRSILDMGAIILRYPSFNTTTELSEKFILLPSKHFLTEELILKVLDAFNKAECYYARFLFTVRAAYECLTEIQTKTREIMSTLNINDFSSPSVENADHILHQFVDKAQSLYSSYPGADRLREEAQKSFHSATYLLGSIMHESAYGDITERRLISGVEGVAESILKELNERLPHIREYIPWELGRSYSSISSISSLLVARTSIILNQGMLSYTRNIRYLTLIMAIAAIVTLLVAVLNTPGILKFIKRLGDIIEAVFSYIKLYMQN